MMTTIRNISLAAAAVIAMGLASCSDDGPSGTLPNDGWYDMVTLRSVNNAGSVLEMQKDGDSDVITYTTSSTFKSDTALHIGDRLIIMYLRVDDAPAYTSGDINLYGYRRLDNKPQRVVADAAFAAEQWESECIDVQTLTRTGCYINMQARLSCYKDEGPATWRMVADAATLADDYPSLYVEYAAKSPGQNFATGYASWDIAEIWTAPTCCGVKIHYVTPAGTVTKTISK